MQSKRTDGKARRFAIVFGFLVLTAPSIEVAFGLPDNPKDPPPPPTGMGSLFGGTAHQALQHQLDDEDEEDQPPQEIVHPTDERVLVSNRRQAGTDAFIITPDWWIPYQRFTVEPSCDYRVSSIDVSAYHIGSWAEISIHAANESGTYPVEDALYVMSRPEPFRTGRWNTFTTPEGEEFSLVRGRKYFVRFGGNWHATGTHYNEEDSTGLPGWTIANGTRRQNGITEGWFWGFNPMEEERDPPLESMHMEIRGSIGDCSLPAVKASPESLTVSEGSSVEFELVLTTLPTDDVTVTVGGTTGTALSANPGSLTFTPSNWIEPQTVTISAAEDSNEADETVTLTAVAQGGGYIDVRGNDVTVTVKDDEFPFARGKPSISGTARVGHTLTAAKGTISDLQGTTRADNGDTDYAYTYQWVRVDGDTETDIADATGSTYQLAAADTDKRVKVKASFRDDSFNREGPLTSDAFPDTGTIGTGNFPAVGLPSISGEARQGKLLTASITGISDQDGLTKADNGESGYAYTYQWVRVDGDTETDIPGATSWTYRPKTADVGKNVKVAVSFTDDKDTREELRSSVYPGAGSLQGAPPDVVLVDNTSNRSGSATRSIMAQGFTTGSNADGYLLSSVGIRIGSITSTDIRVELFSATPRGRPQGRILTLTTPASVGRNAVATFNAPESSVLLPNTSYLVVVTNASGTDESPAILTTTIQRGESSDLTEGWSISDGRMYKNNPTDPWRSSGNLMLLEILGSPL